MLRSILLFLLMYSISTEVSATSYTRHNLSIQTADNVTIRGSLYDNGHDNVIIYCHRLIGSQGGEEVQRLLEVFIGDYDLMTFNFRGHKSSAWISTTGGDEILDLRAVISFAKEQGYHKIVVLGTGMGGSVALRTAVIFRNIDALIVVSPSGFSPDLQPFLVNIASNIMLNTDFGKVPLRVLTNTRLGPRYSAGYPLDYVTFVSPFPLLILQAQDDRFVNLHRLRSSFGRSLQPEQVIVIPGGKHAEELLDGNTLTLMRNWLNRIFIKNSVHAGGISLNASDTSRIVIRDDLPVPEDVVLRELRERLSAHGFSEGSYDTSQNGQFTTTSVLHHLRDVLSFHGYTRTSLTLSDSLTSYTIRVRIPKIHAVSIQGSRWLAEKYIRAVLAIDGDYYNSYELDTALRRLSAEPGVRSATSRVIDREDGDVDIQVTLIKERPYKFVLSTKFTDIDKFSGIGFTWNQFNPSGIQAEGTAMVGMFDRDVLTSLKLGKSLGGDNIRFDATYFDVIKSRDDVDYVYTRQEVHELGGEAAIRYRMTSTVTVNLSVFRKQYTSPKEFSDFPVEEGKASGSALKLDFSGKLPLQGVPRFTWRHTFYHQRMGFFNMGDFDFRTYQLNFMGELLSAHQRWSTTTFHIGWLAGEAPPQEYFSLGGLTTLLGYPDDSFVDTRMMRVSQAISVAVNNWVDETSVLEPLRLVFSFRAGTVWGNNGGFSVRNLKKDVGLELSYQEVLRLGVAVPVGHLRDRSPRFYIGWGTHVW